MSSTARSTFPSLEGSRWKNSHQVLHRTGVVFTIAAVLTLTVAFVTSSAFGVTTSIDLGSATSYSVLAGSTITNTGPSTIAGDVGLSPGTAITGFPPGLTAGAVNAANGAAGTAKSDFTTAYNDAAGRTGGLPIVADLGGTTLTAGVYNSGSSIGVTGTLTLNAEGHSDAVFIFQAGSTLTTAPASSIVLENGAQACNVFWQVGSSATVDTTTTFVGTIMASTSISVLNGATISGRLFADTGAVTLENNVITTPPCDIATSTTTTAGGSTTTSTSSGGSTTTSTSSGGSTTTTTIPSLPHTGTNTPLLVGIGIALGTLGGTAVMTARRLRVRRN